MRRMKVFLTGGDNVGWALDEDLKLASSALEGVVEFSDLKRCDIVHSVWWEALLELPKEDVIGKPIICHVSGEPKRCLTLPEYRGAVAMVGLWIVRTSQAARQVSKLGMRYRLIPYLVDLETFCPLPTDNSQVEALRNRCVIPRDAYLIGTFDRDSEGADLGTAKLAKGPDLLVQVVHALHRRGHPIHVVLAGPRRHWIRRELAAYGIPHTFVGHKVEGDDLRVNVLPRRDLNVLYNLLDLYLVSSRSEGGPHSIMEAAASRCKIISTPVGLAEDILSGSCIYTSPAEGVALIERDIQENWLAKTIEDHYQRIRSRHTPKAALPLFRHVYDHAHGIPRCVGGKRNVRRPAHRRSRVRFRAAAILSRVIPRLFSSELVVGFWHKFFKPPYGGGNQFMRALRKALRRKGVAIWENQLDRNIDAYVLNSIHFDVDRFLKFSKEHGVRVVHRIDGPIHLIRGADREKDELCFRLNAEFAAATVLQSYWSYEQIMEMGYQPVNPLVIHNAVDPDIFHLMGRVPFDPERKIRLISTSWSDNPRKGGPFYKWIEDHLDWHRYEYTLVGRASERFDRIRHISPVPSDELAGILRQHDIYITASQNDPCSNALIEAQACGLPALYLNDGGHSELVGYGGLPFSRVEDIFPQLDTLVENYEMFQNLIVVPNLDDVAQKYLTLLREVAQ